MRLEATESVAHGRVSSLRLLVAFCLGMLPMPGCAQAPVAAAATPPLIFDVFSLKPNSSLSGRSHIYAHGGTGRFNAENVTLLQLLGKAYDTPESRILGVPSALATGRFDVEAKSDELVEGAFAKMSPEAAALTKEGMLQTALAERFHLQAHRETRELPIYHLVLLKDTPHLQPAQTAGGIGTSRDHLDDHGITLPGLAEQLAQVLGRPVDDQTHIPGRFDLTLRWTPDDAPPPTTPDPPPAFFTALEEQLGLKLEPARGPVAVIVVDRATLPTPN